MDVELTKAREGLEIIASDSDSADREELFRRAIISIAQIAEEIDQLNAEMAAIPGAVVDTKEDPGK